MDDWDDCGRSGLVDDLSRRSGLGTPPPVDEWCVEEPCEVERCKDFGRNNGSSPRPGMGSRIVAGDGPVPDLAPIMDKWLVLEFADDRPEAGSLASGAGGGSSNGPSPTELPLLSDE